MPAAIANISGFATDRLFGRRSLWEEPQRVLAEQVDIRHLRVTVVQHGDAVRRRAAGGAREVSARAQIQRLRKPPGIGDVVRQGRQRAADFGPFDDPFRRLACHFRAAERSRRECQRDAPALGNVREGKTAGRRDAVGKVRRRDRHDQIIARSKRIERPGRRVLV
jgi:hypothetical protein